MIGRIPNLSAHEGMNGNVEKTDHMNSLGPQSELSVVRTGPCDSVLPCVHSVDGAPEIEDQRENYELQPSESYSLFLGLIAFDCEVTFVDCDTNRALVELSYSDVTFTGVTRCRL